MFFGFFLNFILFETEAISSRITHLPRGKEENYDNSYAFGRALPAVISLFDYMAARTVTF